MRQTLRFSVAVAVLLVAFTTLFIAFLNSREVNAQDECTLATIQGTYIFEAQGTTLTEDGNLVPYAEAGVWTMDGAGNASGFISASMNAEPYSRREAFTATYELSTACVYAVVDQFGFEVDLYSSLSGERMTYFTSGFSGTMVRQ